MRKEGSEQGRGGHARVYQVLVEVGLGGIVASANNQLKVHSKMFLGISLSCDTHLEIGEKRNFDGFFNES